MKTGASKEGLGRMSVRLSWGHSSVMPEASRFSAALVANWW